MDRLENKIVMTTDKEMNKFTKDLKEIALKINSLWDDTYKRSGTTVAQLTIACIKQILKGNADKDIYMSDDEEGNGYHGMYYLFTDEQKDIKDCDWHDCIENKKNAVILG